MLFINYKTYEAGSGDNALTLTKIIEEVARESQIKIIPVVQALDLKEIIAATSLEIWIQKVDPINFGAHTGAILPQEVKKTGAKGTFLNHSENKVNDLSVLQSTVKLCKEIELKTLVFAADLEELKTSLDLNPDYISYEPPELVGSQETSVAQSKQETISDAVNLAKNAGVPLIIGAGIKRAEDIRIGLKLGAAGFAIASSIVTAEDPKKELLELVEGYK